MPLEYESFSFFNFLILFFIFLEYESFSVEEEEQLKYQRDLILRGHALAALVEQYQTLLFLLLPLESLTLSQNLNHSFHVKSHCYHEKNWNEERCQILW